MSCSGGNCGCGSGCSCGSGCGGCGMYPKLGLAESTTKTEVLIAGVAPSKNSFERAEVNFGAENGCKCGPNCSCDPCNCK